MHKVLLVDPIYNPGNIPPNLGLGHIEAILGVHGVDVKVADFVITDEPDITLQQFRSREAEFVETVAQASSGCTAIYITGSHGMEMKPYAIFPRVRVVAEAVRRRFPHIPILFGGALAAYYISVLKISSLVFMQFGFTEVFGGEERQAAYSLLRFCNVTADPSRNTFPTWKSWNLDLYPSYLSVMMRAGCPYACSFCFEGKVYSPNSNQMVPDQVPELVSRVRERRHVSSVMIEDSIALTYEWCEHLARIMTPQDIRWSIYARSNEVVRKKNLVSTLRTAGCRSLIIGIETFDDSTLKDTNKKVTSAETKEALDLCKSTGLLVQGCLILGFPDDDSGRIERRINTAQQLTLSTYRWHVMQPDWTKRVDSILGLESTLLTDHFDVQVSVPDSCLGELIEEASPMTLYDEHFLVRLLPMYEDCARLSTYGYKGQFSLRDLMSVASPLIKQAGLPTNEDSMYPILFSLSPELTTSAHTHS